MRCYCQLPSFRVRREKSAACPVHGTEEVLLDLQKTAYRWGKNQYLPDSRSSENSQPRKLIAKLQAKLRCSAIHDIGSRRPGSHLLRRWSLSRMRGFGTQKLYMSEVSLVKMSKSGDGGFGRRREFCRFETSRLGLGVREL